jgi:hypothetical protein
MTSHTRSIVLAVACALALPGAARAQRKPTVARVRSVELGADGLPRRVAAPAALPAARRLARVNRALKVFGVQALSSLAQVLEMRVTPLAPQWASDAKIYLMGPGVFVGPEPGAPQGSFLLQQTAVRMTFPTTVGTLYILDCRLKALSSDPTTVTVERTGAADLPLPIEDDHLLHVFEAKAATTKLALVTRPTSFPIVGYFYGCDFGKAQ